MPERNKTKDVLIGVMTVAMIGIIAFAVSQISYKTGTVSQTQTAQLAQSHAVLGTVEQISGQEITLKDFRKISNTGASSVDQLERIVVTVNQTTIIERVTRKDRIVFSKELDAFGEKQAQGAQSTSTPLTPPEPFTLEKITLSDIKVGDSIVASSAEDISKLSTFTATTIAIQN
jgi:hypothetical protein